MINTTDPLSEQSLEDALVEINKFKAEGNPINIKPNRLLTTQQARDAVIDSLVDAGILTKEEVEVMPINKRNARAMMAINTMLKEA